MSCRYSGVCAVVCPRALVAAIGRPICIPTCAEGGSWNYNITAHERVHTNTLYILFLPYRVFYCMKMVEASMEVLEFSMEVGSERPRTSFHESSFYFHRLFHYLRSSFRKSKYYMRSCTLALQCSKPAACPVKN